MVRFTRRSLNITTVVPRLTTVIESLENYCQTFMEMGNASFLRWRLNLASHNDIFDL